MITGHGASQRSGLSAILNRLISFCAELDAAALKEGRYDYFPGEDIVVLINERTTQPSSQRPAEVHRHYGELHYVLSGGECMLIALLLLKAKGSSRYSYNSLTYQSTHDNIYMTDLVF